MLDEFLESQEEDVQYEGLDSETDYEVNEINGTKNKVIFGIYHKIRAFIFFYNAEKEKVRKNADKWAIIGVIIFGSLIFIGEQTLPLNKWYITLLLELAATTCIFAAWFKECFILHGNIRVYYDVEIQLEDKYPFLGHSFKNMAHVLHSKIKDPNLFNGIYYIPHIVSLETLAIIGIYNEVPQNFERLFLIIGCLFLISSISFILIFSKFSGSSTFKRDRLFQRGEIIKILDENKENLKKV